MKNIYPVQKKTVIAVQAALLTMLMAPVARAETDSAVADLTELTKEVEVGVVGVSKRSYKFGEYNGLGNNGVRATGGFDIGGKGGENSTLRWTVEGTDLGLDTRRLEAEGGQQGLFKLHFVYDELPHKISDSYQTIFNGVGSTALTLPASYPLAATRLSPTYANTNTIPNTDAITLANWNNIQAPNATAGIAGGGPGYLIPALVHNQDIGFKRTKTEGDVTYIFSPGWEAKFAARQDDKKGTKLTGYAFASSSTATMLAEPINFKTNEFDLSLGYTGEKANFNLAYLYSEFKNDVKAWSAATPFATGSVLNDQALLSGAPESRMQQIKLGGGYRFTPATRLSFEGSSLLSTQDSTFNCQTGAAGCVNGVNGWIVPVVSANAKVTNDKVFVKLTSRPISKLNLSAAYKYDHRNNQTPVNTFRVSFADSAAAAASNVANDPIDVSKTQYILDAEYAIARAQALKLGLQRESIERFSDGSGFAPSRTTSTANTNDFSLPVHKTNENAWNLEYRNSVLNNLTGRISYTHSVRKAQDYSQVTPAATTNDATLLTNAYYRQFRDFFVADRTRDKARSAFNYQIGDAWTLGAAVDYNRDAYMDAAFKEAKSMIYNFDLSYTASEDLSVSAFYSTEDRDAQLAGKYIISSSTAGTKVNGMAATNLLGGACSVANHPCILANWGWTMAQADKVDTFGIGVKQKGLFAGKLDLNSDLVYIRSRTPVTAGGGGSLISDGAAAPNYVSVAPASYPEITSRTLQLTIKGSYKVDKTQSVRAVYMYQRLENSDWQYDAYTNPVAMQSFIGTGMTAPRYNLNVLGVSYVYSFK